MEEAIQEFLQELEEDGIQYAHFFSHPAHPGYYGVLIRERTPEYIRYWLPHGPLREYSLAFSLPVDDADFLEYMTEQYTDQKEVKVLQYLFRIDQVTNPERWIDGLKTWKQERIRQERASKLEQYPWEVTPQRNSL